MSQPDRPRQAGVGRTMIVAILVALGCSALVSVVAVNLRERQLANADAYRQEYILRVAGRYDPDQPVAAQLDTLQRRFVDLGQGEYVETPDPEARTMIPPDLDLAGIGERRRDVEVYLVRDDQGVESIILPIYGKGLWSTMRGFIALGTDGSTVRALTFYEHAETPGLGDGIAREAWLEQWEGKAVYDAAGNVALEVVRGRVDAASPRASHQVDGMAGATLTGRGVTGTLRYWLGPHGYGPWIQRYWRDDPA